MATKELLTEDDDLKVKEELVITEEDPTKKVVDPEEREHEEADARAEASAKDEDEREAIRERRRLEKIERKERKDRAISRDKLEMEFLRKRNDDLERRLGGVEQRQQQSDVSLVDQRLREALNEVDMAEKVIAKAVNAGNGDDVAQAMRYRDQAIVKAQQLKGMKAQVAPQPAQDKMDDMTLHYAQEFVKQNSWYDPQGKNEESAIVLAIDQALVRDGFDPKTEEYWDELRTRAARRLPEKFSKTSPDSSDDRRMARGGPAIGSGREHAPASTRKEVYISPERKQALMDAGVWDDPILRMKYVRRYAEYDRNNRA
jgi:hypothetical protein